MQEAAGIEPNSQKAALDDPEFAKYFEASSSNPSEITSFLTPGQMQSILAIRRHMGRMKIRYTPEQIRVTFYDFEPAGYAGHNHTGLPLSFTADHLNCLLRDMETLLQNLHGLWEELPTVS